MGKAYKKERHALKQNGKMRFLDIYYYHDGTRILNLRGLADLGIFATYYNRGKTLTKLGDPVAEWRLNKNDLASEKLPQKRNKQEANHKPPTENWKEWNERFLNGEFALVVTL